MLEISPEKVCYLVVKSREYEAKVEIDDPDSGSNASDDSMIDVLEDSADDPVLEELTEFINALNEEEQVQLVALTWLGRGDYSKDEFAQAVTDAQDARTDHTATYLLGIPLLPDYLEEGLSQLGYSCDDFELGRL
jgi:hypothetical protein